MTRIAIIGAAVFAITAWGASSPAAKERQLEGKYLSDFELREKARNDYLEERNAQFQEFLESLRIQESLKKLKERREPKRVVGVPRSSSPRGGMEEWNDQFGLTRDEQDEVGRSIKKLEQGEPFGEIEMNHMARYAERAARGAEQLARSAAKLMCHSSAGQVQEESDGRVGPFGFMTPRFEGGARFVAAVALLAGDKPFLSRFYESALERLKSCLSSPPRSILGTCPLPGRWWTPVREYEAWKGRPLSPDERAKLARAAHEGFLAFFPLVDGR